MLLTYFLNDDYYYLYLYIGCYYYYYYYYYYYSDSTTGLFGKYQYLGTLAKYLLGHCDVVPTTRVLQQPPLHIFNVSVYTRSHSRPSVSESWESNNKS